MFIPLAKGLTTRAGVMKDLTQFILTKAGSNPFSVFVVRKALLLSIGRKAARVRRTGKRRTARPRPKNRIILLAAVPASVKVKGSFFLRDAVRTVQAKIPAILSDELRRFRGA